MRFASASISVLLALSACRESKRAEKLTIDKDTASSPSAERGVSRASSPPLERTERSATEVSAVQGGSASSGKTALVADNDVDAAVDLLESPPSDQVELGHRLASAISDPAALSDDERQRIAQAWQTLHSTD
jgi:hypothetical protein